MREDHPKQTQQSLSEEGDTLDMIPEDTLLFAKERGELPDSREQYKNHSKIRIQTGHFSEEIYSKLAWEALRKVFDLVKAQINGEKRGVLVVEGYPNVFYVPASDEYGGENLLFVILAIYCRSEGWWRIDGWSAGKNEEFQVIRPSDQYLCSRRISLDI